MGMKSWAQQKLSISELSYSIDFNSSCLNLLKVRFVISVPSTKVHIGKMWLLSNKSRSVGLAQAKQKIICFKLEQLLAPLGEKSQRQF